MCGAWFLSTLVDTLLTWCVCVEIVLTFASSPFLPDSHLSKIGKCLLQFSPESCKGLDVKDRCSQWESRCSVPDPTDAFPALGFHTLSLRGLFCV